MKYKSRGKVPLKKKEQMDSYPTK